MSLFDTRHKKKSFTLTTILLSVLLILMFYIGLSYLEPPIETGITVNFGTLEFGSGEKQPKKKVKSVPIKKPIVKDQPKVEESEPEEKEIEESMSEEKPAEKLLTQENEESIKLKQQKEAERRAEEARKAKEEADKKAKEEAERIEREQKAAEEKIRKEQEAKKEKLNALIGGLNEADGEVEGGEGDDQLAGDKGDPDGDPYASTYYGSPGSGSGTGGYGLSGRSLASSGKVKQECNEAGRVVVKIVVDRNGKVVQATPGVKGTNNNNPCLLEPARKTAFLHKWKPDSDAPDQQVGFVVVNFKLGE